jgi:uncharacterized protein (DUF488 family)
MNSRAPVIYTVGHSTRSLPELVAVLVEAGARELVDVRSVPRSRRHPHFDADALARSLPALGVAYSHEPALGGFRRPQPGSANRGWAQEAFRGYADHMASAEFGLALRRLGERARERVACVMCAEAQWWRCHRRLLADALLVAGWQVRHLGLGSEPVAHELTPFAVLGDRGSLTYPPAQTELGLGA